MNRGLRKIRSQWRQALTGSSLCYHSVSPHPGALNHTHAETFTSFRNRLDKLSRFKNLVSTDDDRLTKSDRYVAITFDDAYRDILDEAIPYLISKKIPATIFVNSSTLQGDMLWRDMLRLVLDAGLAGEFIQNLEKEYGFTPANIYFKSKNPALNSAEIAKLLSVFVKAKGLGTTKRLYMSVDELRQVSAQPMLSLGNHSRSHYVLSSLSAAQQRKEILGGKEDLMDLGLPINTVFAAPFGGYATINATTLQVLEEGGYTTLLLTNGTERVKPAKLPGTTKLAVVNRYLPKNT